MSTVKAYIRKATVEFLKKEYSNCLATCETALKYDDGKHAKEINGQIMKCRQAMYSGNDTQSQEERLRKAASDPEIMVCIFTIL